MKKTERLVVRLTTEQMKILEARAINSGFTMKADYVRSVLFMKKPLEEQMEELLHEIKCAKKQNNKHFR